MLKNVELMGLDRAEMAAMMVDAGFPAYRGEQLYEWIFAKGVLCPDRMTNLPKDIKHTLLEMGPVCPAEAGRVVASGDGTRKIEVVLRDGYSVETVLIPDGEKLTQCISSQVGCSVGCGFCRSGSLGFFRNLTVGEILSQIWIGRQCYHPSEKLTNVVFMGIGEPLHNYGPVLKSYRLLCDPRGIGLSTRRVTISTAGIVKGIERLGRDTGGQVALAVSLHAADDETRRRLVPGIKSSLAEIVVALKAYPLPSRRRLTIEYVLVRGVNDTDEDARKLVRLLNPLRVKINLLPLNPHDGCDFEPPSPERVEGVARVLTQKGVSVFLRRRRGDDVLAACGQLLAKRE